MSEFPISVPNPPQPSFPLATDPEQQPIPSPTNPDQARLPILASLVGPPGPPGPPGELPVYDPVKTTLIGDGVTSVFVINGAESITNPAAVTVSIEGELLEPGVGYVIAGGLITFTDALVAGQKAVVISVSHAADVVGATWHQLKDGWETEPTFNMNIAEGEVWVYPHQAATYYRLIPEPYVSSEDTFYAAFSNGVLSEPIVSRSQPIQL